MKRFTLLFTLVAFTTLQCSKEDDDPQIEVTEGIFLNEIYPSSGEDWIEIYNDEETSKDLAGYKIYDDANAKYALPEGTMIPAKGFLIVICDDGNTGLHTNFKLSSMGETVYLENADGKVIDRAEFPSLNDGESYGRYPDGTGDFGTSGTSTKGQTNGDSQSPLITSVTKSILIPDLDDDVVIKAEIISNSGIQNPKLYYRIGSGGFTAVTMTKVDGLYEAEIPAYNTTGKVEYYISVENTKGKVTFSPFDAPSTTYYYLLNTDELPQLKINEFLAANTTCCPDNDGEAEEFDDWIEIYNAGTTAIDIGGMYISDDKTNPFKSYIEPTNPSITTIPPGGFLVLWADEQGSQGELHMNFKLSGDGEDIGIFYKDGRTIDVYTFNNQTPDVSTGRSVNGGNNWTSFASPTPGQSNE